MTWFERHLNWTTILSWVAAWLFSLVFGWNWDWGPLEVRPIVSGDYLGGWTGLIGAVGALLIILIATGWALRRKNRSLLHLFWYLLTWIGMIVLLCLKNQSEVMEVKNGLITRLRSKSD